MTGRLVGRFPAIESTCGWSARPGAHPGGAGPILLAGGSGHGATGPVPVLQCLDRDGERFRLTQPARGRSIEPAPPAPIPGGDVALATYEHDLSLRVSRVDPRGQVVAADELPDDDP